jgi:RimJ/RimL family protein N-acetyltransferase
MSEKIQRVGLRSLVEADAERIVNWLSNPEVIRSMPSLDKDYAKKAEHWRSMSASPVGKHMYVVQKVDTNEDIGLAVLYNVDVDKKYCYAGLFIGDPALWRRGLGFAAFVESLRKAFDVVGVESVYAIVNRSSDRIIGYLKGLGFKEVSPPEKSSLSDRSFWGLSRENWERHKPKL